MGRLGKEAIDPIEELVNAALQFEATATPTLQRFLDWFDRGEWDGNHLHYFTVASVERIAAHVGLRVESLAPGRLAMPWLM